MESSTQEQLLDLLLNKGSKEEVLNYISHLCRDTEWVSFEAFAHKGLKLPIGSSSLRVAALMGRWDVVMDLFKSGISDKTAQGQESLLTYAVVSRSSEAITFLLEHGYSVSIRDNDGNSMPFRALQYGYVELCKELIVQHGADPLAVGNTKTNQTLLHLAVTRNNEEMVRFLVDECHCDLEAKDCHRQTPLHLSVVRLNISIASFLIERGSDVNLTNGHGLTALSEAIDSNRDDKNQDCSQKLTDMAAFLLNNGADPLRLEGRGPAPMHLAVFALSTELLSLFIREVGGIDALDGSKDTPLHYAARHTGSHEVVSVLLAAGCNPNAQNDRKQTPLHLSLLCGEATSQALVKAGASPNTTDLQGQTSLHVAVLARSSANAKWLLSVGANADVLNAKGFAPLHLAVIKNFVDVLVVLLECGANVDIRSSDGQTPSHLAAMGGNIEALKVLLAHGAGMLGDTTGVTPLHCASSNGYAATATMLLDLGADVHAVALYPPDTRCTPLGVASRFSRTVVRTVLEKEVGDTWI